VKKVKKIWYHELKCAIGHYYQNESCQGKSPAENHWHSRPKTNLCYQGDDAWRFIWTALCKTVQVE